MSDRHHNNQAARIEFCRKLSEVIPKLRRACELPLDPETSSQRKPDLPDETPPDAAVRN